MDKAESGMKAPLPSGERGWGEGRARHQRILKSAEQTSRARELRGTPTLPEKLLWGRLRAERLCGWKFRRQAPIGPFVADFLCPKAKLIIEIDGGQHANEEESDTRRTAFLRREGYRVIRFWNNQVLNELEAVLSTILLELEPGVSPLPNPSPLKGEGLL